MDKEKFKSLARDMRPFIDDMTEVLKMHGVEELAFVSLSSDGYFNFHTNGCGWYMCKLDKDSKTKIEISLSEELT